MRLFQIFLLLYCRLLVTSAECLWRFWKYTLDMPSCRLPKRPFHIQRFFPPYILNGAKSKKIARSKYLDPLESSRKAAINWGFIRADGGSASGRHLLLLPTRKTSLLRGLPKDLQGLWARRGSRGIMLFLIFCLSFFVSFFTPSFLYLYISSFLSRLVSSSLSLLPFEPTR